MKRAIFAIGTCVVSVIPVSGIVIHPILFQMELQGRFGGMLTAGLVLFVCYILRERKGWVALVLIWMLSLFYCRQQVNTVYWIAANEQVIGWLESNEGGVLQAVPGRYVGSAWVMPGKHSWERAVDIWWKGGMREKYVKEGVRR